MKRFLIRTDASLTIGTGHVRRCLVLAHALKDAGHEVHFWCDVTLEAEMYSLIIEEGFPVIAYQDAPPPFNGEMDWLIVDHYELDAQWERRMRSVAKCVMVIDDRANRPHDCDLFLDQNVRENPAQEYSTLLNSNCIRLFGPRFALLRDEFSVARESLNDPRENVERLFINMGGADPHHITHAVVQSIEHLGIQADIVIGQNDPALAAYCESRAHLHLHVAPCNIAQLMSAADIAIGAGGVMSYERACMALPSVIMSVADNQIPSAKVMDTLGAARYVGAYPNAMGNIAPAVQQWVDAAEELLSAVRAARALVDGRGVQRILPYLTQGAALRPATCEDNELLFEWRNQDSIRRMMHHTSRIDRTEHEAWFAKMMSDPARHYFIYSCEHVPLGMVQFTRIADAPDEASWGFYIGEETAPKGSGERMCRMALQHAMHSLGLTHIHATIEAHNAASLALHTHLGFTCHTEQNGYALTKRL